MIKAVIFDLDGTLVRIDREYRRNLLREVLGEFNVVVTEEQLDEFWFMHSRELMVEKWGLDVDEFWKRFLKKHDIDQELAHTFKYDDVDYLKKLRKQGIKLALLTGSSNNSALRKLNLLKIDFDVIVNAHLFTKTEGKPHPAGAEKCLRLLKTKKEETIYVGNSDEDILTARNAGIFSILIDRKEHKHDLKPDKRIESLKELDDIIFPWKT